MALQEYSFLLKTHSQPKKKNQSHYFFHRLPIWLHCSFSGVMISEHGEQSIKEFGSYWVPHTSGFVPQLSKAL